MTCKPTNVHPNVAAGWGCCSCKASGRAEGYVYNSARRKNCKVCGHARCDALLTKDPWTTFVAMHTEILAVIRPADPKMALAEIDRIMQAQKDGSLSQEELDARYQAIPTLQEYTFVGILDPSHKPHVDSDGARSPKVLSPATGEPIDACMPGDSFVPYHALVKSQETPDPES